MEKTFTTVMLKELDRLLEEAKENFRKEVAEHGFTFIAAEVNSEIEKKVA